MSLAVDWVVEEWPYRRISRRRVEDAHVWGRTRRRIPSARAVQSPWSSSGKLAQSRIRHADC